MATFQRLCKVYRSCFDRGHLSSIMQDFLQMVMSDGMYINNDQTKHGSSWENCINMFTKERICQWIHLIKN